MSQNTNNSLCLSIKQTLKKIRKYHLLQKETCGYAMYESVHDEIIHELDDVLKMFNQQKGDSVE